MPSSNGLWKTAGKALVLVLFPMGFAACAGTMVLKDDPLKSAPAQRSTSDVFLRAAVDERQAQVSMASRTDATLPPDLVTAHTAQSRPAIMGSAVRERPAGSPQAPETKGADLDKTIAGKGEALPVTVTETPGGGLSRPLSELPPASPPMLHPEPKVDEEALSEKLAEIPPTPPGSFAVQYADDQPPSRFLTDNPEIDQSRVEGAPAPGTPPVAFADADDNTTGQPPDTDMDVSDSYVVTDYNSIVKVYDKAGNLLAGPVNIQSIFNSTGSMPTCGATETATSWLSDPQVRYDEESQRWFLAMLRVTGSGNGSYLCLACSQSSDPRGSWRGWETNVGATTVADYPHMGVGQDAVFIGSNDFVSGSYSASYVTAVTPKANLLSGGSLTWTRASLASQNGYTPQPVKRHGYSIPGQWPPSGTPHYILAVEGATTGAGQVWRWTYPTATGSLQYVNAPGLAYLGDATYPGSSTYVASSTQKIDPLDFRWMDAEMRWPYIWAARTQPNTSDTTCHGGAYNTLPGSGMACDLLQWGQLDVSSGTPTIVQQGNYAVTGNHLFCPDVAVDKSNNFAVGYTYVKDAGASGPTFVSAYLSGRESTDTLGTLAGPLSSADGDTKLTTYNQGTAPSDRMRWGDYLSMAIDPNGCDLWFNGMRAKSGLGATYNDQSYVQKFRFASCTPGPTIAGTLDKATYGCTDTVRGSITDTGGTPTNAVYHSTTGGAVAASITGGPNAYTVAPTTVAQLGAVSGDSVWLSFTGSDAASHNSANSSVKCTYIVCLYKVDMPAGGCDGDPYIDSGETVGLNIALVNSDIVTVSGPFQATLSLSVANPNVQIYDRATATWGSSGTMTYSTTLSPNTYAYADYPFLVKYTGPIGTTVGTDCRVPLNFQVVSIQDANGGWSSNGCTGGSNQFTELANANPALGTTVFSQTFDGGGFPPTRWASYNWGAAVDWARSTGSGAGGHPPNVTPHAGAGMAWYDAYTAAAGTRALLYRTSASTIPASSPVFSFWMYHDSASQGSNDYIQIWTSTNGTSWSAFGQPIYRVNSFSGWENHVVDLSSIAGQSLYLGLMATSAHGNGIFVDDVALASLGTPTCQVGSCAPAPVLAYSQYSWSDGNCNSSGVIDPGESGLLTLFLANTGNDWAYGTTATLTCPTCPANWGTICKSTATYGDIPYGTSYVYGPGSNGFEIAVNTGVACGTTLPFVVTASSTNPYGPVALATTSYPVKVGGSGGSCTSTTCTGSCGVPAAPVITAIYDNAPCVQNGIKVTYTAGTLATRHDLYKDGGLAVTSYVSGALYNPGDSSSHSYVVRAVNAYGGTNSTAVAFADASAPVASISGASANVCPAATVTLSTDAGYTNYEWYVGGSPIGGATTSSYDVGASGSYTVSYTLGGCTAMSSAKVVSITCCTAITPGSPADPSAICSGGTTTLTVSATGTGLSYQWYQGTAPSTATPVGTNSSSFTTPALSSTTNYWVRVSSSCGTVDSRTATVTVIALPAAPVATNSGPVCAGSVLYLYASTVPGATYSWTGPSGFSSSLQNPVILNAPTAAAGVYSVTATVGGCTSVPSTTTAVVNAATASPSFTSALPIPDVASAQAQQVVTVTNTSGSSMPTSLAFTWAPAFTFSAPSTSVPLGFWQEMRPYGSPYIPTFACSILWSVASSTFFADVNGNGAYDPGVDHPVSVVGNTVTLSRTLPPGSVESADVGYRLVLQSALITSPDAGNYPVTVTLALSCGTWSAALSQSIQPSSAGCPPGESLNDLGNVVRVTKSGSTFTVSWSGAPTPTCALEYAAFMSTDCKTWTAYGPLATVATSQSSVTAGLGLNVAYILVAEMGPDGMMGPLGAYGQ